MYPEYHTAYIEHSSNYGQNTAIFYLVGKFYEMYDWIRPDGKTGTSMSKVVDILGIQMSLRKGDGPDKADGYFAGVPEQSLHKYAALLTRQGWTVVIYDQVKDAKGAVVKRAVTRILTPGTHVEAVNQDAAYVGGIWLEDVWGSKEAPSFAVTAIDLTTGRAYTYEGQARGKHSSWSVDDAIHFFQVYSPRECTLWWRGDSIACPPKDTIRRQFGLQCPVHILPGTKDAQGGFEQQFIREEFLRKTIQIQTLLPIRESLGLSEKSERILCATLQRIEELFPSGATKFYPPTKWSPNSSLFLGNQALVQLNMITPREEDSVLGLFLGTQTAFGKRAMRNRLLYPLADPALLEQSYNEIEVFNEKRADLLKQIGDLPRLHRRLMQGDFNAQDVLTLDQSYTRAAQIAESLSDTVLSYRVANIQRIHTEFLKLFSAEKALKASDTRFCFQTGVAETVDTIEAQLEVHSTTLDTILQRLKEWATTELRYDFKETMSPTIVGTKASMGRLIDKILTKSEKPYKMEIISKKSPHLEVGEVATAWFAIQKQKIALQDAIRVALLPLCSALAKEISPLWDELETWLAKVDVSYTLWKRSKEYGFVRPVLVPSKESAISIEGLRHPLIERQATRTEYVKHSVDLDRGWLVYGMNASGKSSLMKAVGIAVLLAQAGCFVPATTFRFTPFQSLFTRILNTDNLWAGLSSFAVEMTELREILNRSNENTLVLGDELCSGTESISATALVGASLEYLHNLRAKFIFATHFHGLLTIPSVTSLSALKVWHLKVRYDPATDILVYERTLTPGPGSSLYGLEVARAMNLPEEILTNALAIRRTLLGTANVLTAPKSEWNSMVQRRECEICKVDIVNELEVHHIQERAHTVNGRNRDGTHQNDLRNLIVVCSKCHDDIHDSKVSVGSVVQTSEGPKRTIKINRGWSAEEIKEIEEFLKEYPLVAPKRAVYDLERKGIKISVAGLKTFRKGL